MRTKKCKCCGKKFEKRICGGNYCMECTREAIKIRRINVLQNKENQPYYEPSQMMKP